MSRFLVTNAQYLAFSEATGSEPPLPPKGWGDYLHLYLNRIGEIPDRDGWKAWWDSEGDKPDVCLVATRDRYAPGVRLYYNGFRVVATDGVSLQSRQVPEVLR